MKKNILILGISGSLGHTLFFQASKNKDLITYGTLQSSDKLSPNILKQYKDKILTNYKVENGECKSLEKFLSQNHIDVIINCIGVIKQQDSHLQEVCSLEINSNFPHYLDKLAQQYNSRLIHISSDCVFDGKRGNYKETDTPNADDLYGKSKLLGEVTSSNSITLRTSFIGHETHTCLGLLEWFLSQKDSVNGFTNALFSGSTTVELSNIILNYIIPNEHLDGILHVGSSTISKFDLLNIIKKVYKKDINIVQYDEFKIDRSLDISLFIEQTSYTVKNWEALITELYESYQTMKKEEYYLHG